MTPQEAMFLSQQEWGKISKKRNEEAKAKMLAEVALEEAEAERRRALRESSSSENATMDNYGPGDLSELSGAILDEDEWESSKGSGFGGIETIKGEDKDENKCDEDVLAGG
eukprot:CAMPEP_0118658764 /NCGR_PEP_ID=MMETSP0785-20121206/14745_1 /TAXON_ID=91992 /ORGANISM="Bolidomonas pacifica, Strain CCMP 1866" /LENGTH=110 /DNA_ID=CAMNT_0006551809 /DNA_START=330 /DNA_END=659 /DNA_ORIENTATION=-